MSLAAHLMLGLVFALLGFLIMRSEKRRERNKEEPAKPQEIGFGTGKCMFFIGICICLIGVHHWLFQ